MVTEKTLTVKLFFNRSNKCFYIQLGDEMLFVVRDAIVAAIQEKEKIEIVHVDSIKEIQYNDRIK